MTATRTLSAFSFHRRSWRSGCPPPPGSRRPGTDGLLLCTRLYRDPFFPVSVRAFCHCAAGRGQLFPPSAKSASFAKLYHGSYNWQHKTTGSREGAGIKRLLPGWWFTKAHSGYVSYRRSAIHRVKQQKCFDLLGGGHLPFPGLLFGTGRIPQFPLQIDFPVFFRSLTTIAVTTPPA